MIKKFSLLLFITLLLSFSVSLLLEHKQSQAATDTITLTATVSPALTVGLSSNNYAFGVLTPGTPVRGSGGINIDVLTSSEFGYSLYLHDSVVGTDSALLHTDTTTRIPDYSSLIALPTLWNSGTDVGLGFTMYAAETSKEVKWGAGNSYNHAQNKYAGVPQAATAFHSSPGYKADTDTSSISFILDVLASQKTGDYSGIVTVTALANLE